MNHPQGSVFWLTGIPGSGKTTIANALVEALRGDGRPTLWLDSDDLRRVFTPNPTYSEQERNRFYFAIRHIAILGATGGCCVVISATAPKRAHRDPMGDAVERYVEIFVDCPVSVARQRDPKGLYRAANAGDAPELPGVGVAYEAPRHPDMTIDGVEELPAAATGRILEYERRI